MSDLKCTERFKIAFYGFESKPLSPIGKIEVLELDGRKRSRWSYTSEFLNHWLLFLDKDCIPSIELIEKLQSQIKDLDKETVYTGRYVTSNLASRSAKAYNIICNHWLDVGTAAEDNRILGGCFLVFCGSTLATVQNQDSFAKIPKWGAEDFHFSRVLRSIGFKICSLPELSVLHEPKFGFSKFIRRAFLHGFNRPKNFDSFAEIKFGFLDQVKNWIPVLKLDTPFISLIILLHLTIVFCGQALARITAQARKSFRWNRPLQSKN